MQLLRAGSAGSTDEPRINRIHNVRAARSLASRRSTSSSLLPSPAPPPLPPPRFRLFSAVGEMLRDEEATSLGCERRTWPSGASPWRVTSSEAAAGAAAGAAGRSPSCCRRSFTCACSLHSNAPPPFTRTACAFSPLVFLYYHPRFSQHLTLARSKFWWQDYCCERLK